LYTLNAGAQGIFGACHPCVTEKRNYTVEESHPGIYNVKGDIMPIQLIDSRRLSAEENLWLKELDNRLNPLRIRKAQRAG